MASQIALPVLKLLAGHWIDCQKKVAPTKWWEAAATMSQSLRTYIGSHYSPYHWKCYPHCKTGGGLVHRCCLWSSCYCDCGLKLCTLWTLCLLVFNGGNELEYILGLLETEDDPIHEMV